MLDGGMPTAWTNFPCSTVQARWRYLDDGHIELEGSGVPFMIDRRGSDRWPAAVLNHKPLIDAASRKYGVPANWIAGVEAVESGGNERACSPCSACPAIKNCSKCCAYGPMQITEGTGRMLAAAIGLPAPSTTDLFKPAISIELGTKYLADLLKTYKGDFISAATAYNAGSIKCLGALTKCQVGYWGVCTDGSPYPLWAMRAANSALAHGFAPDVPPPPFTPTPPYIWDSPVIATAATALAAFAGYLATQRALGKRKRPLFAPAFG